MTDSDLRNKILEFLREFPNSWTSTIHWRITGNRSYAGTMSLLKQMEQEGLVIGKRHSNNNITWRIA